MSNEKEPLKVRTYQGEYSLMHWIDLILSRDIVLPPYQRYFVWNEKSSKTLIKSFKENQFVPPVIIGTIVKDGKKTNLILDGQQRLTSIFLAAIGLFPDREKYAKKRKTYISENNTEDGFDEDDVIEWTYESLLSEDDNTIESVYENNKSKLFKKQEKVSNNFLYQHFLGFSYVLLDSDDLESQNRFFSSTFRNINFQGKPLDPRESREALYYMNEEWGKLLNPKITSLQDSRVDFVRYLSLLTQYEKNKRSTVKIAYGYRSFMENYYEKFIYSLINNEDDDVFGNFQKIVSQETLREREELLEKNFQLLGISLSNSDSIIDVDIYCFGIIFLSIFLNKSIPEKKIGKINQEIKNEIVYFKNNELHIKSPSTLQRLYERMDASIRIFTKI